MVKINRKSKDRIVHIRDMKDGQIGEIVKWDNIDHYIGRIVQRHHDILVTIGENSLYSFDEAINHGGENLMVRLLEPGEELRIIKN